MAGIDEASLIIAKLTAYRDAVRESQPDSVIVLSFRTTQTERIEALQRDLVSLIQKKRGAHVDFVSEEDTLNGEIDDKLHTYGI